MTDYILKWEIKKRDAGKNIKDYLKEKGISKRTLANIKFNGGLIKVDEIERTVRYILHESEHLEVVFPPEEKNSQMIGENIPLNIQYEDEDILIINKPSCMNTIPSKDHPNGSLANGLLYYYESYRISRSVHIVTRLDRDTSGLVLVAKHRHAHHLLSIMQKNQVIERTYEAFVEGVMMDKEGTINAPIGRDPQSIIKREVREDGKRAVTHFTVLQSFSDYSHVKLKLETGRTHQIRVHLNYIGHPLLGDDLYGGSRQMINRQALHCKELCFYHPFSNKKLSFSTPLPQDLKKLLQT